MNRLKTIFWDLDGTIADTELSGHRHAFNAAFKEFNLSWVWDIPTYINLLKITGGLNRILDFSNSLGITLNSKLALDIHNSKKRIYMDIIQEGKLKLRPGVDRLVNELADNNIEQWIVTTSGRTTTDKLLSTLFPNYSKLFKGFITSEDVNELKPSPNCYLKALLRSNSSNLNSIAIEDSLIGLTSAQKAKLKCIVSISPWISQPSVEFFNSDLLVDHLGDSYLPSKAFKGTLQDNMINLNVINKLLN